MTSPDEPTASIDRAQYAAIAAFRHVLRRFLAFSKVQAAAVGLPAQQHQALLVIAGHAGERGPTVGEIAEQLMIAPHTAAELAARMSRAGLVSRSSPAHDRRRVELALTPEAEALLRRLTVSHLEELEGLAPALARALGRLSRGRSPATVRDRPPAHPGRRG